MTPTPDLRARVLGAVAREPSPARATSTRRLTLAFALAFAPMLAFEAYDLRLGDRPLGFVALNVAGWALLAGASTWGAVARGRSMLGRPFGWLVGLTLALPIALLAVAALGYVPWPQSSELDCSGMGDFRCCDVTLALAVGPLLAFAFARRGSDPVHPRATGAAIGASAGAWAAVAMAMHCPVTSMRHVLFGHVVPVVVFAALGVLVGAKIVAVRARAT